FVFAWLFAAFERQLARWWLGADIGPLGPPRPPGRRLLVRVRDHLPSAATWKGILYLLLQFPAGMIASLLEVFALSLALAMAITPFWFLLDRITYQPSDIRFSGVLLWVTDGGAGVDPFGLAISLLIGAAGV